MSFRTVVVKDRCKLDLKMNYMVCRKPEETKVFIPEISVLILESTAISLTTALLADLIKLSSYKISTENNFIDSLHSYIDIFQN